MSFDDMPDLGPFLRPDAKAYAENCLRLSRQALPCIRHELDIPYGPDFFQKLDIFLPESFDGCPTPVLIFFHGGAWKNGFKEWLAFMAPPLISLPAIFISANYRLAPRVKLDSEIEDCCEVVAWVSRNIARFGGDPRRIHVGGHSAGGHLTALITLRPQLLSSHGVSPDSVKACFALSAAFNLQRKDADPVRAQLLELLLKDGERGAKISPINYVRGNRTPIHIAYGSADLPEVIVDNRRMIELLQQEDCAFEHHLLDGQSHFDTSISCGDPNGVWVQSVRRWMSSTPMKAVATGTHAGSHAARTPVLDG